MNVSNISNNFSHNRNSKKIKQVLNEPDANLQFYTKKNLCFVALICLLYTSDAADE